MKRQGQTLNARQVKAGRALLRWAASGMNWGPGANRDALCAKARALLGRGAPFAAQFGRAAEVASASCGAMTQTSTTALVEAASAAADVAADMAADWERSAAERDEDRHWNAGWTYDAQTDSLRDIAAACRMVSA